MGTAAVTVAVGKMVETAFSGEAARLYHEAKELYRASHKTCPDAGPQQGFGRVQAKAHPDMELVQNLPGGGGFARALKPGVQLEAL